LKQELREIVDYLRESEDQEYISSDLGDLSDEEIQQFVDEIATQKKLTNGLPAALNRHIPASEIAKFRKFFNEYVGQTIVSFEAFHEEIDDLDLMVSNKIISKVKKQEGFIILFLNDLKGNASGSLKIKISVTGQFAEIKNEEEPSPMSMYRVIFYNGHCIEYRDSELLGFIEYEEA
jgi:hypothetical protein